MIDCLIDMMLPALVLNCMKKGSLKVLPEAGLKGHYLALTAGIDEDGEKMLDLYPFTELEEKAEVLGRPRCPSFRVRRRNRALFPPTIRTEIGYANGVQPSTRQKDYIRSDPRKPAIVEVVVQEHRATFYRHPNY